MAPERRAVLALLGLALLGHAVRLAVAAPGVAPGQVTLAGPGAVGAPAAHRDSSALRSRPLGPGETVDLDRASAAELSRLPRVGPGLARRIVADREARGPFGSLAGLDRVAGVGPGLLAAIAPHAAFSGIAPGPVGPTDPVFPARALVDLNRAPVESLEALPFVGPYMAAQIVRDRARRGPFPSVDSLVRVPGVGPATVARIRDRVMVAP